MNVAKLIPGEPGDFLVSKEDPLSQTGFRAEWGKIDPTTHLEVSGADMGLASNGFLGAVDGRLAVVGESAYDSSQRGVYRKAGENVGYSPISLSFLSSSSLGFLRTIDGSLSTGKGIIDANGGEGSIFNSGDILEEESILMTDDTLTVRYVPFPLQQEAVAAMGSYADGFGVVSGGVFQTVPKYTFDANGLFSAGYVPDTYLACIPDGPGPEGKIDGSAFIGLNCTILPSEDCVLMVGEDGNSLEWETAVPLSRWLPPAAGGSSGNHYYFGSGPSTPGSGTAGAWISYTGGGGGVVTDSYSGTIYQTDMPILPWCSAWGTVLPEAGWINAVQSRIDITYFTYTRSSASIYVAEIVYYFEGTIGSAAHPVSSQPSGILSLNLFNQFPSGINGSEGIWKDNTQTFSSNPVDLLAPNLPLIGSELNLFTGLNTGDVTPCAMASSAGSVGELLFNVPDSFTGAPISIGTSNIVEAAGVWSVILSGSARFVLANPFSTS